MVPRARAPLPLAERLRPRSLSGIVGQPEALAKLRQFAESWRFPGHPPRARAALLEGVPGTGKTASAYALAEDFGWGVVELGASDIRNRESLERIAGRASLANSFSEDGRYLDVARGGRTLILIDDADSMSTQAATARPSLAPTVSWGQFLRTRYRTVEALNQAWKLSPDQPGRPDPLERFEQLTATGPRGNLARLPEVQRDLEDWKATRVTVDYSDRGGAGTVASLLRETLQPLLLTAIDARALTRANSAFRQYATRIRFLPLHDEVVRGHLHQVALAEGFAVSEEVLRTIAKHVRGDLRAALNDLEVASAVPPGIPPDEVLGWRDMEGNLYDATRLFLSEPRFFRGAEVMERTSTSPDELLPWIEENLDRSADSPGARGLAWARLGRAQLALVRAQRQRVWSQWSFASEMMTGGVSMALHPSGRARPAPPVEFPRFLGMMGSSRTRRTLRSRLELKLGRAGHLSAAKVSEEMLPFVEQLFARKGAVGRTQGLSASHSLEVALIRSLSLEPAEIALLLGVEEDHPSVRTLVGEAETASPFPGTDEGPGPTGPKGKRKSQRSLF